MPISNKDLISRYHLHVSNGKIGFPVYIVSIKESGVYIEGIGKHLLHISLHNRPLQNDPSLASCHIRIPRETLPRINLHGFSGDKYFKWERRIGLTKQPNMATVLNFPTVYGREEYAFFEEDMLTGGTPVSILLRSKAAVVEVWYSGLSKEDSLTYYQRFAQIVYLDQMPNGEMLAVVVRNEETRDYATFRRTKDYRHFRFESGPENTGAHDPQLHFGWYGSNCFGVVHGNMTEQGNIDT